MKDKVLKTTLFLLLIFFSRTIHAVIPDGERAALITLYNYTNGDKWTNNDGWQDGTLHTDGFSPPGTENNWQGITIVDGHVTAIDLRKNNVKGFMPRQLKDLEYLRTLDLTNDGTGLKGSMPNVIVNLNPLRKLHLDNKVNTAGKHLYERLTNRDANGGDSQVPANVPPTIVVTEPAVDVRVTWNGFADISWDGTDPDSDAGVEVFYDNDRNFENGVGEMIWAPYTEDGSTSWHGHSPNWGFLNGTYYICCVINDEDSSSYAYADGRIIVDSWVKVTVPNGGEIWETGSTQLIQWEASDDLNQPFSIYLRDGADNSWTPIGDADANARSYEYTVPGRNSSQCRIFIWSHPDGGPVDISDGTFSIVMPPGIPIVTTAAVSDITFNGAICGGNVTSGGGGTVTARGVCWSTTANPTTANFHSTDGSGTGSFTSTITGLSPDTAYYVRAYAVNSAGTAYGEEKSFTSSSRRRVYSLYVKSSPGAGVAIAVSPKDKSGKGDGATPFKRKYRAGTHVTLTAPSKSYGKYFLKWLVDGTEYSTAEIQVTMNAGHTARAVYQSTTYPLSVQSSPSGVNITVAPPDNNGNGNGGTNFTRTYNPGTAVTLTAPASFDGGTFIKWKVNGKKFTDSTVKIIMEDSQKAVAYYETPAPPGIAVNRASFNLGYITGTGYLPTESITLYNNGGGTLQWTASTEQGLVSVHPVSGTGYGHLTITVDPAGLSPGEFTDTIYISDPLASNSPVEVKVRLWVKDQKDWVPPRGEFSTPQEGALAGGSLPVTGWALGDTGIRRVEIFREEGKNLVYIGDAVFIEGARTDIEAAYPDAPMNYKAGWGYMMFTNFLPNGGNGSFRFHAVATGNAGKKKTLGIRTITVENGKSVKPFGTIDTPGDGETISGSNYLNWGWALTPLPNTIPTDGSTIDVFVDGVNLGNPTYNIYREDIAGRFPDYSNSNGALGFLKIDTGTYANGSHHMWWIVTDNAGNSDGIGSRFFNILNPGTGRAQQADNLRLLANDARQTPPRISPRNLLAGLPAVALKNPGPITVFRGFNQDKISQRVFPLQDCNTGLLIHEAECIELHLESPPLPHPGNSSPGNFYGCMLVGEELRPLPVGSTLDTQKGIFYWIPGPGFFGDYDLLFVKKESNGEMWKKQIRLTIVPKFSR